MSSYNLANVSHLDRQVTDDTTGVSASYNSGSDTTTWTLPYGVNTDQTTQGHLTICRTDTNQWLEDPQDPLLPATVHVTRPASNQIAVSGFGSSLAAVPVIIGVLYNSSFEFSTIYFRNQKGGADQRGRLSLKYMELSYEPMTSMTVTVTPQGEPSYEYVFYDPTAQQGAPEIMPFRFPILARNEDTSIVVSDMTPGSFRIVMADWEGDLTQRARGM